jgi:hypothetical protein
MRAARGTALAKAAEAVEAHKARAYRAPRSAIIDVTRVLPQSVTGEILDGLERPGVNGQVLTSRGPGQLAVWSTPSGGGPGGGSGDVVGPDVAVVGNLAVFASPDGKMIADGGPPVALGSAIPRALGIAAAGGGTAASREDHIHAMPTAADVGAAPVVHSHALATGTTPGFMSAADFSKLLSIAPGATQNSTDAQLRDRSTHTGTQLAVTISDLAAAVAANIPVGSTTVRGGFRLGAGLSLSDGDVLNAAGGGGGGDVSGPAGATDGQVALFSGSTGKLLRAGGLFTPAGIGAAPTVHTHTSAQITDFNATSRAQTEAMLLAGANVTLTPGSSGATRTLSISATPPGGGGGTVTSVAGGDGLTGVVTSSGALAVGAGTGISVGADAVSINRTTVDTWYTPASHSGSGGTAHALATGGAAGFMAAADFTKLAGITPGATVNSTDAALRDRATHTGTQPGSTITGAITSSAMTLGPGRLAGRTTAAVGPLEEIQVSTSLALGAGVLSATISSQPALAAGSARVFNVVRLTQASYDALPVKDPETQYNIVATVARGAGDYGAAVVRNLRLEVGNGPTAGVFLNPETLPNGEAPYLRFEATEDELRMLLACQSVLANCSGENAVITVDGERLTPVALKMLVDGKKVFSACLRSDGKKSELQLHSC